MNSITTLEYRDFLKEAIKDAINYSQHAEFTFEDIVDALQYSLEYYDIYDCEAFKLFGEYSYFLSEEVEKNIKDNKLSIKGAILYTIHEKALNILYQIKDKLEKILNNQELGTIGKRCETTKLIDELYLDCYGDVA